MDLLPSEHDTGTSGILDCELGFPARACDSTDCSCKVVALQRFDVLDLEGLDVPVPNISTLFPHTANSHR